MKPLVICWMWLNGGPDRAVRGEKANSLAALKPFDERREAALAQSRGLD